tara:strand:+ start:509 stop:862 length:354 start_codon:yes stop_codon:yes gene_type:complete
VAPLLGQVHRSGSETYSRERGCSAAAARGSRVDDSAIQIEVHHQPEQVVGSIHAVAQQDESIITHLAGDGNQNGLYLGVVVRRHVRQIENHSGAISERASAVNEIILAYEDQVALSG